MADQERSGSQIEQLLKDMTPDDFERLKALLDGASPALVNITSITGDVVGSAVGSGASVTARDIILERSSQSQFREVCTSRNLADSRSPVLSSK
jgi:hypothetical protein